MRALPQFVFGIVLLTSAMLWAQLPPAAQPDPSMPPVAQREIRPADNAPPKEPPPSPGATLRSEIEAGMKAQPTCRGDNHPCVLTSHEKLRMFEKKSYSPFTFLNAGFNAAYSQLTGDNYGPGMNGMAQRYGANLADTEARSFFQTYLFSSLFRQDPRYHRIGHGGLFYRASYAASRVIVGRTDDGRSTLNWPEFLGVAATVTLGNAYYPEPDRGPIETISRGFGSIVSDAGTEVMREFWPDMRRVLRRHEPQSMKRMENKIGWLTNSRNSNSSGASQ